MSELDRRDLKIDEVMERMENAKKDGANEKLKAGDEKKEDQRRLRTLPHHLVFVMYTLADSHAMLCIDAAYRYET
jgi:hypothetical protein